MYTRICKIRSAILRQIRKTPEFSEDLAALARSLRFCLDTSEGAVIPYCKVFTDFIALQKQGVLMLEVASDVEAELKAALAFAENLGDCLRSRRKGVLRRAKKLENLLLNEKPSFNNLAKAQELVNKLGI